MALASLTIVAMASDHWVNPFYDRNGNLHQGHYQTNPNGTNHDNYSTRGNFNPYTGQFGTIDPD